MAKAVNPYGDGHACEKIADILKDKSYQERKNKLAYTRTYEEQPGNSGFIIILDINNLIMVFNKCEL